MTRWSKNNTALLLMAASILMLAAFLVFWLRKEYREQKSSLLNETGLLFQQTVRVLEDSLLNREITAELKKNTSPQWTTPKVTSMRQDGGPGGVMVMRRDSGDVRTEGARVLKNTVTGRWSRTFFNDTGLPEKNGRQRAGVAGADSEGVRLTGPEGLRFFINLSSSGDRQLDTLAAIRKVLRPFRTMALPERAGAFRGKDGQPQHQTQFVVQMDLDLDTLRADSVAKAFGKELEKARIPLGFRVTGGRRDSTGGHGVISATGTMPPGMIYSVVFPELPHLIYSRISPQVTFSVLLLAITAVAFGFIYVNLRRQTRLVAFKNDFISNITHELKTPIATVGVAIEALRHFGAGTDPKLTAEYLEISEKELEKLSVVVDKALRNSLLEEGRLVLELQPTDLYLLAGAVLQNWKPQFIRLGAGAHLEKQGEGFVLHTDSVHLQHVLNNLIDNALKYSREEPELTVKVTGEEKELLLEVIDNGIGIPEEYRRRIFEKFFRVPSGDRHNVKGYGLGLNYVWNVVRELGGKITVSEATGGGTRFCIRFKRIQ